MRFQVIFTVKNQIAVFNEVVEAESVEQAREQIKMMVKQAGLQLKQITAVIEL